MLSIRQGHPGQGEASRLCPQEHSAQGSGGVLRRKLLSGPSQAQKRESLQIEILFPGSYPAGPFCGNHWPELFPLYCVLKPQESSPGNGERGGSS